MAASLRRGRLVAAAARSAWAGRRARRVTRAAAAAAAAQEAQEAQRDAPAAASVARFAGGAFVVTGATSGIGKNVAERLLAAGAPVVACGRRADRLAALRGDVARVQCDLAGDPAGAADRILAAAHQELGATPRVLVNSAGLGLAAPLLAEGGDGAEAEAAWAEMLAVNVLALCVLTRRFVAAVDAAGGPGHVVNLGSLSGYRVPGPGTGGFYAATKHAVRAITEGTRQELRLKGSPVRVSAVSPGLAETEFSAVYNRVAEEERDAYAKQRYGKYKAIQADDVADAVFHALAAPAHLEVHDVLIRAVGDAGI